MKTIGTAIRNLRLKNRLSQTELAHLINVPSQSKISAWECGNSIPDILEALRLAEVFKLSLEELIDISVDA
ncbi:DNA-binding XRE family transcriptional regulator [Arcicella aurantiaca]|jgi:transcriptional regulator with XRE-family HTH domain|uniref:DNA-binding XRE family transcriptional regulator n=1 Tax=Arcicella aurantiaca TaxID=591202 RepID=A0A316DI56_9BACT|nr:helix-turn-helix transcriptional regulator [Arcicella aurantiaca]PWK16909.1 DNA-binding XRE family transcriptional regulator [Arcicella aurantiaca]